MKRKIIGVILGVTMMSVQLLGKTYEIGATQIVEHSVLDSVRIGFEDALKDSKIDYKMDYQSAQGDMPTQQLITKGFADKKKDIILAISTPTAQAALNSTKNIPILFGAVSAPKAAGLLESTNVTGVADTIPQSELIVQTKKYFPKAKRIGVIYNTSEKNSENNLEQIKIAAKANGMEVVASGVTALSEVPMALDVILSKTDVIYMLPDNMVVSAATLIYDRAKGKKIPVLALGYDESQLQGGGLLSVSVDYRAMGYRIGQMAVEILKGKTVKELPFETPKEYPIIINKEMAKFYNINLTEKCEEIKNVPFEDACSIN